MKHKPTDL